MIRRRLFTGAAAISLGLCLATVGLWVRSYFVADIVSGSIDLSARQKRTVGFWSGDGRMGAAWVSTSWDGSHVPAFSSPPTYLRGHIGHELQPDSIIWEPVCYLSPLCVAIDKYELDATGRLHVTRASGEKPWHGFWFVACKMTPPVGNWMVGDGAELSLPCWLAVAITFVLPALAFRSSRRATRSRMLELCNTCSYDLNRNTSGVCPECGTPVAGKAGVKV